MVDCVKCRGYVELDSIGQFDEALAALRDSVTVRRVVSVE